MFRLHLFIFPVLILLFIRSASSAVLENLFSGVASCELQCEQNFPDSSPQQLKACSEGCRLFRVIGLANHLHDNNKTVKLCESACSEAFVNETKEFACNYGCRVYPLTNDNHYQSRTVPPLLQLPEGNKEEDDIQTLHLLTPLMYVKSAYDSMAHHVKQFISTSWTVYVQEDSGKMVILQTSPKVVESLEYSVSSEEGNMKDYQQGWYEAKLDWMDCISHQSGIPRWLLVVVLFAFIFALLWLCCATAVTAPNQYLQSSKKKDMGYILICEPNNDLKSPLLPLADNEEAPPLPPKISLI